MKEVKWKALADFLWSNDKIDQWKQLADSLWSNDMINQWKPLADSLWSNGEIYQWKPLADLEWSNNNIDQWKPLADFLWSKSKMNQWKALSDILWSNSNIDQWKEFLDSLFHGYCGRSFVNANINKAQYNIHIVNMISSLNLIKNYTVLNLFSISKLKKAVNLKLECNSWWANTLMKCENFVYLN